MGITGGLLVSLFPDETGAMVVGATVGRVVGAPEGSVVGAPEGSIVGGDVSIREEVLKKSSIGLTIFPAGALKEGCNDKGFKY